VLTTSSLSTKLLIKFANFQNLILTSSGSHIAPKGHPRDYYNPPEI
jgi:hypothetical protein